MRVGAGGEFNELGENKLPCLLSWLLLAFTCLGGDDDIIGLLSMTGGNLIVWLDVGTVDDKGVEVDEDGSGLEAKIAAKSLSISIFLDISIDDELLERPVDARLVVLDNVTVLASR